MRSIDGGVLAGLCGDKGSEPEAKRGVGLPSAGKLHHDNLHDFCDKAEEQQGARDAVRPAGSLSDIGVHRHNHTRDNDHQKGYHAHHVRYEECEGMKAIVVFQAGHLALLSSGTAAISSSVMGS